MVAARLLEERLDRGAAARHLGVGKARVFGVEDCLQSAGSARASESVRLTTPNALPALKGSGLREPGLLQTPRTLQ